MMSGRRHTPSERRMAELCRITHRPLKLGEAMDIKRLRIVIYNADWKRERYANDPAYRDTIRQRVADYKARRRADGRA